jgi:hypothetical protein
LFEREDFASDVFAGVGLAMALPDYPLACAVADVAR